MRLTFRCLHCDKEEPRMHDAVSRNKFCTNRCQKDYQFLHIILPRFKAGKIKFRKTIKHCLIYMYGEKCFECNLTDWRGSPITLEVDHINGNASDDMPINLRLLCPNCHSITPTWKGANRGAGRKSLGLL